MGEDEFSSWQEENSKREQREIRKVRPATEAAFLNQMDKFAFPRAGQRMGEAPRFTLLIVAEGGPDV